MRIRRAAEDQEILKGEMNTLQQNLSARVTSLEDRIASLEDMLTVPLDQRPTPHSVAEGRYALCRKNDGVLCGLLAMCQSKIQSLNAGLHRCDKALAAHFSDI